MQTQPASSSFPVSHLAQHLIGSEIIKLAGEIKEKIKQGDQIFNLTIGDFDPQIFPVPAVLKDEILQAYESGETNYPEANGMQELRSSLSAFLETYLQLHYAPEQILVSGGARPLIYATYLTLVDEGDKVIFPVPSWNNNHYTYLSRGIPVVIETSPENHFMPTADDLRPHIQDATLVALCSPLNPTGTVFSKKDLHAICHLIMEENKRRKPGRKPVYLMYDQIYWALTFGEKSHYDPVTLHPEMRPYTIFIDGISKAFAATGVRVGWAFGPQQVMDKMKSILSHIGAWAPKAEQIATARFLNQTDSLNQYLHQFKNKVEYRLEQFHAGFQSLKSEGFPVDSIEPQGGIYLTVKIDARGMKTEEGMLIDSVPDISAFLIQKAGLAMVPFSAFGFTHDSAWFRLSVGTCREEDIPLIISRLKTALSRLN